MAPKIKEEEYFTRLELERKRKIEEEKQKRHAEEEKNTLKELHYMRCPKCGMELSEIDHKSVKIDKCHTCNGIWLDAGELETISKLEQTVRNTIFDIFRK
jgi:uncharacterized protein with PIN domain